jgi:DNA-binding NarL/FixJ family response regulator
MPPVTILVVDDFEPFRRFVCPILEREAGLRIIGEASDGLKAVQKIEELQPDLILLDIGLPGLNGMEVARRASKLAPNARILFVSQESSFDVVQEALGLGALGYVHKQHGASELLDAVKTVLAGRQFVSSSVKDYEYFKRGNVQSHRRHEAVFCSSDAVLLESLTGFIVAAQKAGNPAIVIATKSHLDDIFQRLRAQNVVVEPTIERGSFVPLEVSEVLAGYMVDDMPDPVRFFKSAASLLDTAANAATGEHKRIAACGEGLSALVAQGKADAALRLEQFWNLLARRFELDLLCAYAAETFDRRENDDLFRSICAEHSAVHSR